jgi:hypothetical protein
MSSPLARNLLREFTNWRPRTSTKKCQKCKHEYSRHTMFPLFSNIFLDTNSSDSIDYNDDYELDTSNNVGYTYCCHNYNVSITRNRIMVSYKHLGRFC